MKLVDKKEMSEWAFRQCWDGNDTTEIRNLINDAVWVYAYYTLINDRKEMKLKISNKEWSRVTKHVTFRVVNNVVQTLFKPGIYTKEIDLSSRIPNFNAGPVIINGITS